MNEQEKQIWRQMHSGELPVQNGSKMLLTLRADRIEKIQA